ncbi:dTDP-4-dehydrorhamnose reductase [Rhodococcus aerolatus]
MSVPPLLVTGGRGQLGTELAGLATGLGVEVSAPGSAELDVTDADAVDAAVARLGAGGVVVSCAAHTAVDAAETEVERATALNATAPGVLAAACARHGARLVHVSTDYVFAGDAREPYGPDAPTGPRTVYGRTKLAGERAVLAALPGAHVVRTAWVYGAHGPNFVATMARLERERDTVGVVADQVGSPTWTADLAAGLLELAGRDDLPGGVLHATGAGTASWWDLARAVFGELGADPERVLPVTTADFPRPAPRPAYSVLSDAAWVGAGLAPLPPWRDALHRFVRGGGLAAVRP